MKKTLDLYQTNDNFETSSPLLVKESNLHIKNILLVVILFIPFIVFSQIKYGVYGGINFAGQRSSYDNIRSLPVVKGGVNTLLGFHANKLVTDVIELETGLNYSKKGFTYEQYNDFYGIGIDEYNVFNAISLPVTIYYNIIPKDDYGEMDRNLILSIGAGFYGSYFLKGTITDEDGNNTNATFSKMKRFEGGVRGSAKMLFAEHFEVFIVSEFGLVNLIKTDTGHLFQNSLIMGVGYQF